MLEVVVCCCWTDDVVMLRTRSKAVLTRSSLSTDDLLAWLAGNDGVSQIASVVYRVENWAYEK